MLTDKDKMNLDLLLCSFSLVRSPCQFSGTLYARSTLTAHVSLKAQETQFNSEDVEERNYTVNVVEFCTAVLITKQWRIQNHFTCVSSLTEALSLVTLQ